MASVRNLKKDVNYLVYELLADTYTYSIMCPDKNKEEINTIIAKAITLQDSLLNKITAGQKLKDKKEIKKHFNSVQTELIEEVDKSFKRLSEMIKE